nr:12083_t:CDS:2 [Entrophospora candida]
MSFFSWAVGLQGAATCLLTAARTLTTNNSSLENEIGEQRDLNLLREFNSGDLRRSRKDKNQQQNDTKDFVLEYFNSLIENDPLLKSFMKHDSKSSKSNAVSNSSSSRSKANSSADTENGTKKKRNRIKKPVDPNAPKKPVSAFLLYQKDVQDEIRKEFPDTKWNDILRIISQRWQSLSNDDKKIYETKLQQARHNYEIEYKTYMENKDNSSSNMIETTDDNKETASSSKKGMDDGDDKFKNHIKKSKKDKINFTNIDDGEEYGDDLAARKRSHIKVEGDEAVRPTIIVGNNRDLNNNNDNLHKLSPNNKTKKKKPKDITTETRS